MLQQLSDMELEIMKIVWANPAPVTLFSYLMEQLAAKGKPCQKNTLIVLLSRLCGKAFLRPHKVGRRNEYTPLVSQKEYQAAQTQTFVGRIYEGDVKGLISHLIEAEKLTSEEYEELRAMLQNGRP